MVGGERHTADQRAAKWGTGAGDPWHGIRARPASSGLGETCQVTRTVLRHAISADGSRAFWTYVPEEESDHPALARVNGSETIQLDKAANPKNSGNGIFRAASADGSVVYFTDEGRLISEDANPEKGKPDLYRYEFGVSKAQTLTDLTKGTAPGRRAGRGRGLRRRLLRLLRRRCGAERSAQQRRAAGRSREEQPLPQPRRADELHRHPGHRGQRRLGGKPTPKLRARVSPDGRHLAFLSIEAQKLAGYDNTIAAGEHCQYEEPTTEAFRLIGSPLCPQAFLYDADDGELSCASCNPSGSRPLGPTLLPGWSNGFEGPRYLSDDGLAALLPVLRRAAAGR